MGNGRRKLLYKLTCPIKISSTNDFLVINRQSSMMGLDFVFHLLAPVPKEPVNFHWRQIIAGFLANLLSQFLHSDNGTCPNFQFLGATKGDDLMPIDSLGQTGRVSQNSNVTKNLRNSIIGKHRQFVNVMKEVGMRFIFLSSVGSPNICNKNLCALVEVDQTPFVDASISEAYWLSRKVN